MSTDAYPHDRSTPHTSLVEVGGFSKSFGGRMALSLRSLSLDAGEVVGLLGANGSGKTTCLRTLAGLLRPDTGRGSILGFDLLRDTTRIRRGVGYLSQQLSLYGSLSVRENLRFRADVYGLADWPAAVETTMARFDLKAHEYRAVDTLSGGWARTVQLAAALMHEPKLILLDEPTVGLDPSARQSVWGHIMRFAADGRGVLLSTHDISDACRCSRIVLLSQGGIFATGTPADLVAASSSKVLLVSGPGTLRCASLVQQLSGVLTTYPSGGNLRVLVNPGAVRLVTDFLRSRELRVEPVEPSFEDAVFELTKHDPVGMPA